jgi:hypothetical protein
VTQELEQPKFVGLLDVTTGELLTPSVDNAARVLNAARAMKANVNEIVSEATAYLVSLSEHQGTKTLHGENETVTVSGGPGIDYDPLDLREALEAAGCPQDRIEAAVKTEITYKVDRAVLRQLAAANEDYRAAIQLAELEVEKPYRASLKLRRNSE